MNLSRSSSLLQPKKWKYILKTQDSMSPFFFFHSTEKFQSPTNSPPIQLLLPKSPLYTEIKRRSQRITCRQGKLKTYLEIRVDVLCHRRFCIVIEMATKHLITAQSLTPSNMPTASWQRPQSRSSSISTITEIFGSKPDTAGYCALTILSFFKYQSCRLIYFHPLKKGRWGMTTTNSKFKSVTTVTLQFCPLGMGEPSLSHLTCIFSNNLVSFESNAFGFVTFKLRGYTNLTSRWEGNLQVWCQDSPRADTPALCWSSPVPRERSSAPEWQHPEITPTAQILPAYLPTPHNCHFKKQESPNPQQHTQLWWECRGISIKVLQQAPRSCKMSTKHGHFSTW